MATQTQVDGLQARLISAKAEIKSVMDDIVSAAENESAVDPMTKHVLKASKNGIKHMLMSFHRCAEGACNQLGITPGSIDPDK